MVILGDLLDILNDVTKLEVWAYDDYRLQHKWIFGEGVEETIHQWHERKSGILSIIDRKINFHGDPGRKGTPEMGWGVNKKDIPPALLKTEVLHILLGNRGGGITSPGGRSLFVYVNLDALTAEVIKTELAKIERPLEE